MKALANMLTVGSLVRLSKDSLVYRPITAKVKNLLFDYKDVGPLVECENLDGSQSEGLTWHIGHLELVAQNDKPIKWSYEPTGFLFCAYHTTKQCLVYRTLFNKFGHRISWKDKLYDIGGIRQQLFERERLGLLKTKKAKVKFILGVAPKHLIKRKEFTKEYEKDCRDFYDEDYELTADDF